MFATAPKCAVPMRTIAATSDAVGIDDSREVRQCPESREEREELGFHSPSGKSH